MAITYRFLAIEDDLKDSRVEWLIGYPQYVYSYKLDSFGVSAVSNLKDDKIIRFRSGLRLDSFLELLEKNKDRLEHVLAR